MAAKVLVFEDFSGGDSGRSRPVTGDTSTFRAINAWAYPSGIGPRPPFQALGLTGLIQQKLSTFDCFQASNGLSYLVFAFANGFTYRCPALAAQAVTGVGDLGWAAEASGNFGDYIYFARSGGTGGKLGYADASVTLVAGVPAGRLIARYGQQGVVATDTGLVKWSTLNDFDTYPAANSVQVGAPGTVGGLYNQRNTLVVAKLSGELWQFRGVLGVNETLSRIDVGLRHRYASEAPGAVVNQSNLWYCGTRQVGIFTGAQLMLKERPDTPAKSGYVSKPWDTHLGTVMPLMDDNELMLVGTLDKTGSQNVKQLWAHAHRPADNWTRHLIPVTDFTVTGLNPSTHTSAAVKVAREAPAGVNFIATGGDTSGNGGSAPQVYSFFSQQEFPLVPNGTQYEADATTSTLFDGASGVPTVATFQTAEHWSDSEAQLTVRSVVIDYSYDPTFTPFSTYNRFDVSVEALQAPGSVAVNRSTVQAFTPASSGDTPDGSPRVRGQQVFQMGDQGGGVGFRIRLDDWRGILVHRITAVVDEAPVRW